MIKVPYEKIVEKIKEKSGISDEEINTKVDAKLKQLSGLISKEGAAHIIANELGIDLIGQVGGKLEVKNVLAGMRNVEIAGKVTNVFNVNTFQRKDGSEGKVGSFVIGDSTGTIRIVLWGSQTDIMPSISVGKIIKVLGGYARDNSGQIEVHTNDNSKIQLDPPGETVGEVKIEKPQSVRKKINELNGDERNVELMGTIVQAFDLRFFEVCPKCGKRARLADGTYSCGEHNNVQPDYSYVLNVVLDDGTETIRSVFFRDHVKDLLKKTHGELLNYKEDINKFNEMKNELLGHQIKISGNSKKNEMFDRLEFVANSVADANPEEELAQLNK